MHNDDRHGRTGPSSLVSIAERVKSKRIPMVGRIAVVEDPQGGVIGLHECEKK